MSLTTRPSNFREKVFFRKLRSQVDGNSKVEHGLTEKDTEIIRAKALEILNSGRAGESLNWDNPESQNKGKITLLKKYTEENQECCQLVLETRVKGKKAQDAKVDVCRQSDGSWIKRGTYKGN